MIACLSCREWTGSILCTECRRGLRIAAPRSLEGGLTVNAAYEHERTARRLIHRLKYEGIEQAAWPFIPGMAAALPAEGVVLVPVPRVWWRRTRYGIDPAAVLASLLARRTGLRISKALAAPLVVPRHAGRSRSRRHAPRFSIRISGLTGVVLIDDVCTTGSTLEAAESALEGEVLAAVTASSSGRGTSLRGAGTASSLHGTAT